MPWSSYGERGRTPLHTQLPLTLSLTHSRHKEKVIGEEGEAVDVVMLLEAVQLHARVVVDVEAALLSHSKQHLIVQEPEQQRQRAVR